MDTPPKTVLYIAGGLGAGILALILWDKYRQFKAGGGVAGELGEAILGAKESTDLQPVSVFDVKESDLPYAPHVPMGIWCEIQEPSWGMHADRTRYFGSEIDVRFTLKNLGDTAQRIDLELIATETDWKSSIPVTHFLGSMILEPKKGYVMKGSYKVDTTFITSWNLDVRLTVAANRHELATTDFKVS